MCRRYAQGNSQRTDSHGCGRRSSRGLTATIVAATILLSVTIRVSAVNALEVLMRCAECGATVGWVKDRRVGGFLCPECGALRPISRNARPEMADRVFRRDHGICHRCGLEVDRELPSGHPLSAECDHHPIPKVAGGPTIEENLKLAHRVCNGGRPLDTSYARCTPEQAAVLDVICGIHGWPVLPRHTRRRPGRGTG